MVKGFIYIGSLLFILISLVWYWHVEPMTTRWLYGCQRTLDDVRCNDPKWACLTFSGLPFSQRIGPTLEMMWERPEESCRILYFHGRGRSVRHNFWQFAELYKHCSIVAFEYPSCQREDYTAKTLLEKARQTLLFTMGPQRNYLMCASFGCSILLSVLSGIPNVTGLILENPPTSMTEVAAFYSGIPRALFTPFIKDDWSVWDGIRSIPGHVKVLLLTSERDELIPSMAMSEAIVAQLHLAYRHVVLTGANHGDAPAHPLYKEAVVEFIKQQ